MAKKTHLNPDGAIRSVHSSTSKLKLLVFSTDEEDKPKYSEILKAASFMLFVVNHKEIDDDTESLNINMHIDTHLEDFPYLFSAMMGTVREFGQSDNSNHRLMLLLGIMLTMASEAEKIRGRKKPDEPDEFSW